MIIVKIIDSENRTTTYRIFRDSIEDGESLRRLKQNTDPNITIEDNLDIEDLTRELTNKFIGCILLHYVDPHKLLSLVSSYVWSLYVYFEGERKDYHDIFGTEDNDGLDVSFDNFLLWFKKEEKNSKEALKRIQDFSGLIDYLKPMLPTIE